MNPRTVDQTLRDMGRIEPSDLEAISEGFDHGNYANAYETQDYDAACCAITDVNDFYRVGMLLGFFSSYELHEVPEEHQDEVAHYREVAKLLGFPGGEE